MRHTYVVGSALAVALLVSSSYAADDLKSGKQKSSMKIVAFNPLHCSGPGEGTKACLV
jgi:hypothetical protein